jgi:hypothetical protein
MNVEVKKDVRRSFSSSRSSAGWPRHLYRMRALQREEFCDTFAAHNSECGQKVWWEDTGAISHLFLHCPSGGW